MRRPRSGRREAQQVGRPGGGIVLGLLRLPRGLQHSRLLDRLLRGRTAIVLVAFALIGIVTLQLGVLKLNSTIGHTLERAAQLQRENAALSIENSELAAGDRVESRAAQLGMELVPVSALRFLSLRHGLDAARAAAALRTPVSPAGGSAGATGSGEGTAGAAATASGANAPASAAESTASEASAPATGESSGTPAGEATQASGESAQQSPSEPASAPASASTPSSSTGASAATAPAEAAAGGGTQAGPTG